jgi:hypothetical protein
MYYDIDYTEAANLEYPEVDELYVHKELEEVDP